MSERLLYLGGGSFNKKNDGLGPSSTVLQIGDRAIGVDCGLEILSEGRYGFPDFSLMKSEKLEFSVLVLTHAHLDHIGGVGLASENGLLAAGAPMIYGSPQTIAISPGVLYETWCRGVGRDFYSSINRTTEMLKQIPLGEFEILPGIRAFTGAAGHIPGALYIIIQTLSGKKVLFCGDNGWHEQEIVGGSSLPDGIPDSWLPDVIAATDLTNPLLTSFDYGLEMGRLTSHVSELLAKKKVVVIAAFAVGREQNVALALAKAGIRPVYADGSGVRIFRIFKENRWSSCDKDFSLEGVEFIEGSTTQREELLARGGPLVIVTPAGFGDGGPVRFYLEKGLEDPNFEFIATSWLIPGCTMDRLLQRVERRKGTDHPVHIVLEDEWGNRKKRHEVKCGAHHFRLSAHGGLGEMVEMVKKIVSRRGGNLETIVLTHGTQESKRSAMDVLRPYTSSIISGQAGVTVGL